MQTQPPAMAFRSTVFYLFMVALVCVSTAFLLATPGFVILVASHWGYGPTQVGMFVTAESVGSALGPLVLSGLFARAPVRKTIALCALAFGLANLGTALHPDVATTLALRGLSGFSSGVLAALGVRYLALSSKSERNLAWLVISQTLYSTLLLAAVLPAVDGLWQAPGAFGLLAIQGLLAIPLCLFFARREHPIAELPTGGAVNRAGALLGLIGIVAMNTAVGVMWTFIDHPGRAAGMSPEQIEQVLSVCNVLSIVSCALVPLAIRRGHLFSATFAALLGMFTAAVYLASPGSATGYAAGTLLFLFSWLGAATLMMAMVPLYDQAGRFVLVIPSALCIGNALGAAIGGVLMEQSGPVAAFGFAAGCCAMAMVLVGVLRARARVDGIATVPAAGA